MAEIANRIYETSEGQILFISDFSGIIESNLSIILPFGVVIVTDKTNQKTLHPLFSKRIRIYTLCLFG